MRTPHTSPALAQSSVHGNAGPAAVSLGDAAVGSNQQVASRPLNSAKEAVLPAAGAAGGAIGAAADLLRPRQHRGAPAPQVAAPPQPLVGAAFVMPHQQPQVVHHAVEVREPPAVTNKGDQGHANLAWRRIEECWYERYAPGRTLHVAEPGSREPTDSIPSEMALRTNALHAPRRPLTHCQHYYENRLCKRGARCNFVHAVFVDSGATELRKAPTPAELGRSRRGGNNTNADANQPLQHVRQQQHPQQNPQPTHGHSVPGAAAAAGSSPPHRDQRHPDEPQQHQQQQPLSLLSLQQRRQATARSPGASTATATTTASQPGMIKPSSPIPPPGRELDPPAQPHAAHPGGDATRPSFFPAPFPQAAAAAGWPHAQAVPSASPATAPMMPGASAPYYSYGGDGSGSVPYGYPAAAYPPGGHPVSSGARPTAGPLAPPPAQSGGATAYVQQQRQPPLQRRARGRD